jgi:hypothetical protein
MVVLLNWVAPHSYTHERVPIRVKKPNEVSSGLGVRPLLLSEVTLCQVHNSLKNLGEGGVHQIPSKLEAPRPCRGRMRV